MKTQIKNRFLVPVLIAGLGVMLASRVTAQTYTTLHSFAGYTSDGAYPVGGLLLAGNTLYGTATYGGSSGAGTVFAVNTDGSGFTILHIFTGGSDGSAPNAGLVLSGNTLYGTASGGGSSGAGTVFAVNTDGTGFTTLHSFTATSASSPYGNNDGAAPAASLIVSGNTLYGTARHGGSWGGGTVFAVNTDGTDFTVLHSFTQGSDGALPAASLILSGNTLYGTATFGGSLGNGLIFAVNTDGTGFTTLHSFGNFGGDGAFPEAGLIISGNTLYGTTPSGGFSFNGTVFAINTDGTGYTVLSSFFGHNGGALPTGVVLSGNKLYGTTASGGSSDSGTVFALNTDGTGFSIVYAFASFPSGDGAGPRGGLILSGNTLYGTTAGGGSSGYGTVFKLALPPAIQNLIPAHTIAGAGDVPVTINGVGFENGSRVFFGTAEVATTYGGPTQLQVTVPSAALPTPVDFAVVQVTVLSPDGEVSQPAAFTVIGSGVGDVVSQVSSGVAGVGETTSVLAPASALDAAGVTATLENSSGTTPATVTVATYTQNPTPAAVFEAGGGFVDLQVSGADAGDRLAAAFYYLQIADAGVTLKFFNGSQWLDVLSSGGVVPSKDTTDNLDGTVSGGRFQVLFDNTSTPQITALNGTVFALAVPHTLQFTGFLAPISGADATGGSFTAPVRTFKAGSTIPVKFGVTSGGAPVTTGVHRLQAIKYSDATTGGTPIDATPQDAATTGNQFQLSGHDWYFNLATQDTGVTKGIWLLVATLSDGSQHSVWVQIK